MDQSTDARGRLTVRYSPAEVLAFPDDWALEGVPMNRLVELCLHGVVFVFPVTPAPATTEEP